MQRFESLEAAILPSSYLAIGSFDGVHQGHQHLLRQMIDASKTDGVPSAVMTFFPHPRSVLGKPAAQNSFRYLATLDERVRRLTQLGLDAIIVQPFTLDFASIGAAYFIDKLKKRIGLRGIWAGPQFVFGHNREGTIGFLQKESARKGFSVHVVEPLLVDGLRVSSSRIRDHLVEGEVRQAADLLGHAYMLEGKVTHGDGRGHTLGIPTANLEVWPLCMVPSRGVYATRVSWDGQSWFGVTNIGHRPTFLVDSESAVVIETHILDFSDDIYGKTVRLDFVDRLRPEERFGNAEKLLHQIWLDISAARRILEEKQ